MSAKRFSSTISTDQWDKVKAYKAEGLNAKAIAEKLSTIDFKCSEFAVRKLFKHFEFVELEQFAGKKKGRQNTGTFDTKMNPHRKDYADYLKDSILDRIDIYNKKKGDPDADEMFFKACNLLIGFYKIEKPFEAMMAATDPDYGKELFREELRKLSVAEKIKING